MCLPIPAADYIGQTYDDYPEWRSRLQDLMERHDSVLELSDRAELPHWLAEPPANPPIDFWERGNRWVLAMALAYDSERSYLLALWDGVQSSAATGGTGHMVRLATATSEFRLERIDTNELVAQLQPA